MRFEKREEVEPTSKRIFFIADSFHRTSSTEDEKEKWYRSHNVWGKDSSRTAVSLPLHPFATVIVCVHSHARKVWCSTNSWFLQLLCSPLVPSFLHCPSIAINGNCVALFVSLFAILSFRTVVETWVLSSFLQVSLVFVPHAFVLTVSLPLPEFLLLFLSCHRWKRERETPLSQTGQTSPAAVTTTTTTRESHNPRTCI